MAKLLTTDKLAETLTVKEQGIARADVFCRVNDVPRFRMSDFFITKEERASTADVFRTVREHGMLALSTPLHVKELGNARDEAYVDCTAKELERGTYEGF